MNSQQIKTYYSSFVVIALWSILFLSSFSAAAAHAKTDALTKKKRDPFRPLLYVPPGYKVLKAKNIKFNSKYFYLDLYAEKFSQGNAVYIEIQPIEKYKNSIKGIKLYYNKKKIPLTKKKWGWRGLFGISPKEKPGKKKILIISLINERSFKKYYNLKISKTWFPVYKRPLDLGRYSDIRKKTRAEIAFIKKSKILKKKAFSHRGPDLLNYRLSHPRDMHYITSPFWSKRVYMRYRIRKGKKIKLKSSSSIHRGLDLRGEKGRPVFAIASGTIVLANKLYYEGNMVIIDHGNRIFSYYMHMNDITVKVFDTVKGGDIIGHVGSTGVSTAAHLHVSLIIGGVIVDPLSLLSLPIKN